MQIICTSQHANSKPNLIIDNRISNAIISAYHTSRWINSRTITMELYLPDTLTDIIEILRIINKYLFIGRVQYMKVFVDYPSCVQQRILVSLLLMVRVTGQIQVDACKHTPYSGFGDSPPCTNFFCRSY